MSQIIRVTETPIFDQMAAELEGRGTSYQDIAQFRVPAFVWGATHRRQGGISLAKTRMQERGREAMESFRQGLQSTSAEGEERVKKLRADIAQFRRGFFEEAAQKFPDAVEVTRDENGELSYVVDLDRVEGGFQSPSQGTVIPRPLWAAHSEG